jgi:DNA-binding response OmpR family regulator
LTADGGEAALKILEQEEVSVMTLDLRMPGLSGPETLLKIREINSELEVIIVTAYASNTETMRVLRLRAFDLVSKPFEPTQVLQAIRRHAVRSGLQSIHGLSETEHRRLSAGK